MPWNVPIALTLTRIVFIPVFGLLFLLEASWANLATTAIFGLAAITDWLDGYLARRWNQTSAFGAFLDPVADKLMVAVALVALVELNPSAWMAVPAAVIIGREIAVSALREWMAELGQRASVAVGQVGKIKTTAQMAAILILLFNQDLGPIPLQLIGMLLIYVAAALTLYSMVVYLRAAWVFLSPQRP
ncbi:CDP-diacylglycerol--glycerol-3-phosphate 3-phosphatidyltransferase [Alkalilimnicola sp. S0819]|uniref:CDP-diacylglycerol--glycerol-3-phosphate 3-phosphatidyltransferase n=1 Tax=Alkalilimnicola sp. S0819 TaxID=2613922 RepID=UPI0012625182|nr:CDP-diacylglycerol--glycerol-3-phosphate 3-phosphatidyltransferase [Alkalilimnicola sp. S0819]KAB7627573.1 CDP-diacylglycerol--glycerol-3-phosphate 3-phosphatidyltransferase [Alkalilimnicola sp. S0819]MPQ15732.1 CDP-diacylglycerol--glycerol-3-phosphate 3-phosphatidyltransferase [Alkalilimnicola sp. S0819]